MPTGYTADISKGISFKEYALGCARAFGALITMRDDPSDAKIPDDFKPSDYYKKEIERIKKKIEMVSSAPLEACEIASKKKYKEKVSDLKKYIKKCDELKVKYETMLAEVCSFSVPQSHIEFRKFMADQIRDSIEHDCGASDAREELAALISSGPVPGEKWKKVALEDLQKSLSYHIKGDKEEVKWCAESLGWVRGLRRALERHEKAIKRTGK